MIIIYSMRLFYSIWNYFLYKSIFFIFFVYLFMTINGTNVVMLTLIDEKDIFKILSTFQCISERFCRWATTRIIKFGSIRCRNSCAPKWAILSHNTWKNCENLRVTLKIPYIKSNFLLFLKHKSFIKCDKILSNY